jgi:hypothetical protein
MDGRLKGGYDEKTMWFDPDHLDDGQSFPLAIFSAPSERPLRSL